MTPVTIGPFTAQNLDPVAAIEADAGDTHWSRAQFEKELSSPISRFFVLHQGANILGYGGYWKVGEEAQITNLAVVPGWRRKGFGARLIRHLTEAAKQEGCSRITLELRSRNQAAEALYRKSGFALQGRRPKVYTQPIDDALLMEKQL